MNDDILRDLVEGERAALVPSPSAKKATWNKVTRSVAIAAPVPAALSGSAAAASKAAASGVKWWTKGIVALAIGGAVAVGVQASDEREADAVATSAGEPEHDAVAPDTIVSSGSARSVPTATNDVAPEEAAPEQAELPQVDELTGVASRIAEPPERPASRAARDRDLDARVPAAPASTGAGSTTSALAEEARLLDTARKKLRAGTPSAALPALKEHARRFPSGQLTEERLALTARAHCEADHAEQGKASAAALRAAYPSSSHLARVDRACE